MSDPALEAAAASETPFLFGAVKIEFPDYTLRLLDGSAEVTIDGELYVGEDDTFGTLDSIDSLTEQIGDEAPEIQIALLPPDGAASSQLAAATMQGSRVTILFGAYDPASGAVIGQPEVLFLGEIDVPTIDLGEGSRTVSYSVVSVFERLFEVAEGERASDGWHQSIWPGELGLMFMTGTVRNLYWGTKRPVPQQIGGNGFVGSAMAAWFPNAPWNQGVTAR
jgi:hypothetical protein